MSERERACERAEGAGHGHGGRGRGGSSKAGLIKTQRAIARNISTNLSEMSLRNSPHDTPDTSS